MNVQFSGIRLPSHFSNLQGANREERKDAGFVLNYFLHTPIADVVSGSDKVDMMIDVSPCQVIKAYGLDRSNPANWIPAVGLKLLNRNKLGGFSDTGGGVVFSIKELAALAKLIQSNFNSTVFENYNVFDGAKLQFEKIARAFHDFWANAASTALREEKPMPFIPVRGD